MDVCCFPPQSKAMKAWHVTLDGVAFRVAMEKDTLDVWVNGDKVETAGEFTGQSKRYVRVYDCFNDSDVFVTILTCTILIARRYWHGDPFRNWRSFGLHPSREQRKSAGRHPAHADCR